MSEEDSIKLLQWFAMSNFAHTHIIRTHKLGFSLHFSVFFYPSVSQIFTHLSPTKARKRKSWARRSQKIVCVCFHINTYLAFKGNVSQFDENSSVLLTPCGIISDPKAGWGVRSGRREKWGNRPKTDTDKSGEVEASRKTQEDIVDTPYVYLPAGVLWLDLLLPS